MRETGEPTLSEDKVKGRGRLLYLTEFVHPAWMSPRSQR
jgi:hypothetical protein